MNPTQALSTLPATVARRERRNRLPMDVRNASQRRRRAAITGPQHDDIPDTASSNLFDLLFGMSVGSDASQQFRNVADLAIHMDAIFLKFFSTYTNTTCPIKRMKLVVQLGADIEAIKDEAIALVQRG